MKLPLPAAASLASVHLIHTASGQRLKVRLISPQRIDWRTYLPSLSHDEAIRRAMESAGISRCWAQAALPPAGKDEGED